MAKELMYTGKWKNVTSSLPDKKLSFNLGKPQESEAREELVIEFRRIGINDDHEGFSLRLGEEDVRRYSRERDEKIANIECKQRGENRVEKYW